MATYQFFSEPKVHLSEDPYWPIRRIFLDIFQCKPVKLLLRLMFLCTTVLIILQTVIFLQVFEGVYFIKYYLTYSGSLLIWIIMYSIPETEKSVSFGIRNLHRWQLHNAGSVVEKSIRRELFYENFYVVVTALLSIFTGIAHVVPDKNDKDFFLALVVFEKFFPKFETLFSFMYRTSYFVLSLVMMAPFHMIIYYCAHVRTQFHMFVRCLQNLNYGYEKADLSKSVCDEEYQKEITRRLKFCIERHLRIYSTNNKVLGDLRNYIVLFSISGAFFGIGLVVYGASFQSSFQGTYLRVVGLVTTYILTYIHIIWAGQASEDVSSQMFEALKQTDWYYWNSKNKKIFLMFLLNGEKAYKLKFSENVSVNYELGVSISRSIFSMITVLIRLKNDYYLNEN